MNAVAPGATYFEGGWWERRAARRSRVLLRTPWPRSRSGGMGSAEEVADVVVFLASTASLARERRDRAGRRRGVQGRRVTLLLAATTAVTWGFGELVYLRITKAIGGYTASLWTSIFGLVLIIPVAIASGEPRSGAADFALAFGGALVGVLGALLYALALQYGQPVDRVARRVVGRRRERGAGGGDPRRAPEHGCRRSPVGGAVVGVVLTAWVAERRGAMGSRRASRCSRRSGSARTTCCSPGSADGDRADLGDRRLPFCVGAGADAARVQARAVVARACRAALARAVVLC